MKLLTALGFALVTSFAHATATPEPVTLVAGMESVPLADHISVLRDEKGEWTIDDVRSPALAARFVASDSASFNYGFTTHGAYWYRFGLRMMGDAQAQPVDWMLDVLIPVLDYLDIHITRGTGQTETILTGDLRPRPPQQIPTNDFVAPIRMAPGEDVTVHLRVQTVGRHQVRVQLWSLNGFVAATVGYRIADWTVQGARLFLMLYFLMVFLTVRERVHLYFGLWLAASFSTNFVYAGYGRNYGNALFSGAPALINASAVILGLVLTIFAILFAREFMQTRQNAPRIHRLAGYLATLIFAIVVLYPMLGFARATLLTLPLTLVSWALLLIASIYLTWRGVRAARFYLYAWGIVVASNVFFLLQFIGGPTPTALTTYLQDAAVLASFVIFSWYLADRIGLERLEKARAIEGANRLKSFLPQKVADLVGGGDKALLEPKRRNVTVVVIDLRGFTPFSETSAPEDVMAVLREFYEAMGAVVEKHGGTVEHFAGDSMLIFFNAPLEIPEPEKQAVVTALEMRSAFETLRAKWAELGHDLGLGIGIADGYATIGAIGFSGRSQYAAIGAVTNLASRLCSGAQHREILTTARVLNAVGDSIEAEPVGEQAIKGFSKPVQVLRIVGPKAPPSAQTAAVGA